MITDTDTRPTSKWVISILIGLLFLLFSIPSAYSLSNRLLNSFSIDTITGADGLPSIAGLLIHTSLFILAVFLILVFKEINATTNQHREIKIEKPPTERINLNQLHSQPNNLS